MAEAMDNRVRIIEGEIFRDHRGEIHSINDFRFDGDVQRFYFLHHPSTTVIRGWHGHRYEKKWFYCVRGSFTIGLVEIDNWESPSPSLQAQLVKLTDTESRIVCVPEGYANCIKATTPNSVMMVFSGKILSEALGDSWRYDSGMWVDWNRY